MGASTNTAINQHVMNLQQHFKRVPMWVTKYPPSSLLDACFHAKSLIKAVSLMNILSTFPQHHNNVMMWPLKRLLSIQLLQRNLWDDKKGVCFAVAS